MLQIWYSGPQAASFSQPPELTLFPVVPQPPVQRLPVDPLRHACREAPERDQLVKKGGGTNLPGLPGDPCFHRIIPKVPGKKRPKPFIFDPPKLTRVSISTVMYAFFRLPPYMQTTNDCSNPASKIICAHPAIGLGILVPSLIEIPSLGKFHAYEYAVGGSRPQAYLRHHSAPKPYCESRRSSTAKGCTSSLVLI